MNKDRSIPSQRARSEAEQWLARRLAPDFSAHAALDSWLRADPDHPLAWETVRQRWEDLEVLLCDERFDAMAAEALRPVREHPPSATSRVRRRGPIPWPARLIAAAALLVIAVLALVAVDRSLYAPATEYATASSEEILQLPDGTHVQLDYHSHIRVTQNWRERYVQLLEGRALFDVAPEKKRPFTVQIGPTRVVATGTRFEVDRNGARVSITLLSGEVLVNTGLNEEAIRLQPGTRLSARGDSRGWHQSRVDAEAALAWTRGFLQFDNTRLDEAIEQVNRYSARPIRLAEARLGELRVSGNFKRGDGARFANALPHVLPVATRIETDHILVSAP